MKNLVGTLIISLLLALFVGLGAGVYIQSSRTQAVLASIPASPIVVSAVYEPEKTQVVFELYNPGVLPIQLVDHSVVFKPGPESGEEAYALAAVPIGISIPGQTSVKVTLALKPGSEELKVGDVVAGTITYTHPLSTDIYAVTHIFKLGAEGEEAAGE